MASCVEQQMLIEQRLSNDRKSAGIACALWVFVGLSGGHRFNPGRSGSGAAMAILTVLGVATGFIVIGFVLLAAVGIWSLIDAFLIPGRIEQATSERRRQISQEVAMSVMTSGH